MKDRKEYIEKFAAQLKEWDADIQKLEAKLDKVEAELKTTYQYKIDELRKKKAEVDQQLADVTQASENAWEQLKDGFETSWKSMNDSLNRALSEFK
jgi:chromosome segregation ATPase